MTALPSDLLPRPGRRSPLPWLIAAAAFLMALAAAAVLALGRSEAAIEVGVLGKVTVSIAEGDPARREAAATRALVLARSTGATAVRVEQSAVRRLVAPYLGDDARAVPLPALIDVELAPGATIAGLRAALRPVSSARVDPEGDALAPLLELLGSLRRLAGAVLLASAIVALLMTTLVARAGLAAQAGTIETLHGLGATDMQLARLVERRTALDALAGGALGLALAGLAIVLLGARLSVLNGGNPVTSVPAGDWAMLALLPLYLAVSGLYAARVTILRQLRRSL